MELRKLFLAMAIAGPIALVGCGADGSDGADGAQGETGATGAAGADAVTGKLVQVGRYESGIFDDGGAEIVAFDATTDKLFVVNSGDATVDVLDLSDPANPTKLQTLDVADAGVADFSVGGANSVAVKNGVLAVAVEADTKQDNGRAYFYNSDTLAFIASYEVGALPDMITFTPDGNTVLVANEGEPNDMYTVDPEGSVSVINISAGAGSATVATADFDDLMADAITATDAAYAELAADLLTDLNEKIAERDAETVGSDAYNDLDEEVSDIQDEYNVAAALDSLTIDEAHVVELMAEDGIRVFGYDNVNDVASGFAQDMEPEYITVSEDGSTAYVALQENNAIAILDVASASFTDIAGLGYKDHSIQGNGMDAVRDDELAIIETIPVMGMYMPDSIASYSFNGNTYVVTANEGDAREYLKKNEAGYDTEADCLAAGAVSFEDDDGDMLCFFFVEEARARQLDIDEDAFSTEDYDRLTDKDDWGDLTVTTVQGDTDGDDFYEELYSYGARSFSIWNAEGELVFDSGDQFEQIVADATPYFFNVSNDNNDIDDRSDNKGPEPEGLTIGTVGERTYAYIGLERQGGIMVYDITNPFAPQFVQYESNRDFSVDIDAIADGDLTAGLAGDLAPEGMTFVSAEDSPSGKALVIVGNEVSGTTTVYEVH